jgi:hypothetical protein
VTAVPSTSPPPEHRAFLERSMTTLRADARIVGVAAGGSYVGGSMDEFSDLDLVLGVEPEAYASVLADREHIAASLGDLVQAFPGEHVGEPRLLICLYDQPLLHVDLKFVDLDAVSVRVEDPVVLWERNGRLTAALAQGHAAYPQPNPAWIEARFWVWIHYAATKIGRGELFEALDGLGFLRGQVLGPLALRRAGGRPTGVRKIEQVDPDFADALRGTVAQHDAADCIRALRACATLYRTLCPQDTTAVDGGRAEQVAMGYLTEIEQRCTR